MNSDVFKAFNKAIAPNRGQCYIAMWSLILICFITESKLMKIIGVLWALVMWITYIAKSSAWRS